MQRGLPARAGATIPSQKGIPVNPVRRTDCECHPFPNPANRREFIKTTATGILVASSGMLVSPLSATGIARTDSETLVQQLYGSLNEKQKEAICFDFEDPLRSKVDNNWFITAARINKNFNTDQQDLIRQIFLQLHSEEYAQQVLGQVDHDGAGNGGFGGCSVALFGQPGGGKFEFVLTGRHVTRRCDGDSVAGAAFGGPIFYGHAARSFDEAADHPDNIYWYQAKRANELFQALDGKQRKLALLDNSRGEHGTQTVELAGASKTLAGLPVAELAKDQKELAEKVMTDLLAPFREADRAECMKLIEKNGFDKLHLSYYKNENIGEDEIWDVWQIEGPATVWYFRGKPHVHTWVHIRDSTQV
jgi:hypothetical protein